MAELSLTAKWNHKMAFEMETRGFRWTADATEKAGGENSGPTPKEYTLSGVIGCTGIDIASILKTMRQNLENLEIKAQTKTTEGHPSIFEHIHLEFFATGKDLLADKLLRAVTLSQTKYCGVSAMIAARSPISYKVYLNGNLVGEGQANFDI